MAQVITMAEPALSRRRWPNPFAIFGTKLPPNVLLMAKLIVLAILLERSLPLAGHFLPFFRFLDRVGSPQTFHRVLVLAFLVASAALFLNRAVRAACIVLGATILLSLLGSRPTYSNNLAYCGAVLFMIGLQQPNREPWLLRLQIVLLYFGAGFNKLMDVDWRSGQFFEYWFAHLHPHVWYSKLADRLPPMLLSKIMSWGAIITELALAGLLLVRRFFPLAIWIGLVFHTMFLVGTNLTFRMFYYAVTASYLAFVSWPRERMTVLYDGDCGLCTKTKNLFEKLDLEHRFAWIPFQLTTDQERHGLSEASLSERAYLIVGDKLYGGFRAFKMLALYNPLTYFALLVILRLPDPLHLRRWVAVAVLLLFSPLVEPIGERVYRWVAHNRYRLGGQSTCSRQAA